MCVWVGRLRFRLGRLFLFDGFLIGGSLFRLCRQSRVAFLSIDYLDVDVLIVAISLNDSSVSSDSVRYSRKSVIGRHCCGSTELDWVSSGFRWVFAGFSLGFR